MWYSLDGELTYNQLTTALTTTCTNLGTTPSFDTGTTVYIRMAKASGPNVTGWGTGVTTAGDCPFAGGITDCSGNAITISSGGNTTVWTTGRTTITGC
jgi:hypothetical protein